MGKLVFASVLFGNVFLYAIAYQMQAPLLPFLIEKLSSSVSEQFAYLQSMFSLVQLIGGIVSGPLMDVFGSKMLIIVSNIASLLCYVSTVTAASDGFSGNKIAMLYLSRVFTVLQHGVLGTRGMLTEQSYLFFKGHDEKGRKGLKAEYEKIVEEKIRAKLLGYVMLAYGIGAAVGPMMGAYLAKHFEILGTTWIACGISLFSIVMCWMGLPNSQQDRIAAVDKKNTSSSVAGGVHSKYFRVLGLSRVRELILCKSLIALVSRIVQSIIPIIIVDLFHGNAQDLGFVMSYSGTVMALIQGLLIAPITNRFSSQLITFSSCMILSVMFVLFSYISNISQLYVIVFPMLLSSSLFATVNTAQLSSAVQKEDIGTVLALDMSLGSAIGIFAPDIGLNLLKRQGISSLGTFCFFISLFASLIAYYFSRNSSSTKPDDSESKKE
jgi:MFS family permease